jgi:Mat/Ecp fimbriae major subunit
VGHSEIALVFKDHIMLNKIKIALASSVVAAAMLSSGAQAATATGTAKVEILVPVQLSTVTDLDFGLVAAGASSGTVTLPVGSNTRACVNVTCVGTASRGSFQVTNASAGQVVQLSATNATLTGPGANMLVTTSLSASSITFDAAALETVNVGGTLAVGINQAAGAYTGSFTVTADYQ